MLRVSHRRQQPAENLNTPSTGGDTINVDATTATNTTNLNAYLGNDNVTINGDALSAANTFLGNTGSDNTILNVTANLGATGFVPITSLAIEGNAPANVLPGDDLNINDGLAGSRVLTFTYLNAPNGDVDITGYTAPVNVRTMETIDYAGDASNNDRITIADNDSAVDPAFVTPNASGASYTRNGGVGDRIRPELTVSGLGGVATPLTLDANLPTAFPGDRLLYNGPAPATKTIIGPGAGTITAAGVIGIAYQEFERVQSTAPAGLSDTIDFTLIAGGQDGNPNSVRLSRRTAPDGLGVPTDFIDIFIDTNTNDVAPEVLFSTQVYASVSSFTVTGGTDADTLIVDHFGNNGTSLTGPFGAFINRPITFNANGPVNSGEPNGDTLTIRGTPVGGLPAAARETYLVGATEDAGTWVIDPDGSRGAGLPVAGNGDEMTVTFTGLEPASSTTVVANFDVIYNDGIINDSATITSSVFGGFNAFHVNDDSGTFESFDFANKTTVRLMGNRGQDDFRINAGVNANLLTTLEIDGHLAAGVLGHPADDNSTDVIQLDASQVANLNLFGNGGDDEFLHGNDSTFTPFPPARATCRTSAASSRSMAAQRRALGDLISLEDVLHAAVVTATFSFDTVNTTYQLTAAPATFRYTNGSVSSTIPRPRPARSTYWRHAPAPAITWPAAAALAAAIPSPSQHDRRLQRQRARRPSQRRHARHPDPRPGVGRR